MKIVKFLLSLAVTGGLVYALNTSLNIKGLPVPALGKLLNPFTGFWQNGDALTATPKDMILPALTKPVKVVYDDRAIPHIFADNTDDAYYVQGYVHATNRLWQMDFISHAAAGRLSELLGARPLNIKNPNFTTINVDKLNRRRGIAKSAAENVKQWEADKDSWHSVQAYCAGVNAYIKTLEHKNYPVEYKILGVSPEEWSPLKSALIAKYMAMDLSLGEDDLRTTNAKTLFGSDFDNLFPTYFKEQSPIVPVGTKFSTAAAEPKPQADPLSTKEMLSFTDIPETRPNPSNGSNNWAVAGSKTKNKRPILCGDPHLGLRLPSIWFEVQIVTPDNNVYGVSLPGLPAVIIGFNENIAWSMTNVGHDVVDWYSIKWTDKSKTAYTLDGAAQKADLRIEEIKIKGASSIFDTVRYTTWGPVVYENDTMPLSNMAFHWVANEVPMAMISTFAKLNRAKNYDEYSNAIKNFNVPAQNFAFACKDGDIALKVTGSMPKKAKGQGRFVLDGSLSVNAWQGYVDRAQNPAYRNPSRGFVSSANQHSTDPSYPYFYNSEFFEAYRGRIVNTFLEKSDTFTVEDMMKMQNSNYGLMASEALPNMIKNLDSSALNPTEKALLSELQGWDLNYNANQKAPIYFEEWFDAFYEATWDEVGSQKNATNIAKPKVWRTVFLLRDEPNSKFFDNISTANVKETSKEILTETFKKMVANIPKLTADLAAKDAKNPRFDWATYKDTEVPHVSNIPGFGRSHLDNGGNRRSINAVAKNHGPSWRMIVELGDTPRAFVVYPGGESGNPGSPHYDDFVDKWTKGEYYEALFMKKADEKNDRIKSTQAFNK
jgi:penicillin G amidase